MERGTEDALLAGLVAATVSGFPSTVWALGTGGDPLEATIAAGSIALPDETRRDRLLAAAVPVHLAVSLGWALALGRVLPRGCEVTVGALAGLGIAVFDLAVIGRRFPRVRGLALAPQLADHALFGATVGYVLTRRRR